MTLETKVGGVTLSTPLLLASGYITETPEFFLRARPHGCSGMVTRSLKENVPEDRRRITAPRYAIYDGKNMLNCEWGNERPWTDWREFGVAEVKKVNSAIVVSVSGRDLESCCYLISQFDAVGVDAFEINISCSHSGSLHGNLNVDLEHLKRLMERVRQATTTPIWIKLSYSTLLLPMAEVAESLGADAIVCTNSVGPGMLIDTRTANPRLGIKGGGGGVTGPAIFPIALWCVHQLAQRLSIPVVGCGGVSTADEAIQMLMAGASAVQLYTAPALQGPAAFKQIRIGLEHFLSTHPEYTSVGDLTGATIGKTDSHQFESPKPVVDEAKCVGCGVCVHACAFDALSMVKRAKGFALAVVEDNCISCNACVGVCPPEYDAIRVEY